MGLGQMRILKRLKESAAELLFPRAACCLCCGDPRRADAEDCLCEACRSKLTALRVPPEACERCLSPVKRGKPCAFCRSFQMKPIHKVYAPYQYKDEARTLIHQMKFNSCGEAVPLLGKAMALSLPERDFDCIAPVPLHPFRLRQRGFNQSLLLCRELSGRTGIPVVELLRRDRYHRPQSLTPQALRQRNVKNAFSCAKDAEGLRVLLVDDVRTTGSTACACAKTLVDAGAESVSLCVAAVVYKSGSKKKRK
ncbi:MAG: ComF family protein [Clostridia bacterium]|nr:ComF family protein [Clostridia bacterium]